VRDGSTLPEMADCVLRVDITDVSDYLVEDSLSVAGHGSTHAVIHSVTVTQKTWVPQTTSDKLKQLEKDEGDLLDAVEIKLAAYNGLLAYSKSFATEFIKSATCAAL
jgi:hypothetical protein